VTKVDVIDSLSNSEQKKKKTKDGKQNFLGLIYNMKLGIEARCLKIKEKASFNIASEFGELVVKQCYQKGQF